MFYNTLKFGKIINATITSVVPYHVLLFADLQLWTWDILYSSAVCYAASVPAGTLRSNALEENTEEL